jgi:hypothetical protein
MSDYFAISTQKIDLTQWIFDPHVSHIAPRIPNFEMDWNLCDISTSKVYCLVSLSPVIANTETKNKKLPSTLPLLIKIWRGRFLCLNCVTNSLIDDNLDKSNCINSTAK